MIYSNLLYYGVVVYFYMFKKYLSFKQKYIFKVLLLQFILLSILFIYIYIKYNFNMAISIFYGGIISIISSILFFVLFFFNNKITPKVIVKNFYIAGIIKILSLILLCLVMFFHVQIASPICFFISLFFMQIMFWSGCILFFSEDVNLYECR